MTPFFTGLAVKATIVILLALAAARLTRGRAASVRHLLLAAAFGVLLLLPVVSLVAPSFRVAVRLPAQSRIAPAALDAIGALDASATDSSSPAAAAVPCVTLEQLIRSSEGFIVVDRVERPRAGG